MFYYKRNTVQEKETWHKWFAWFPVTVSITPDNDEKKVWWQWVYRCGKLHYRIDGGFWSWRYKETL